MIDKKLHNELNSFSHLWKDGTTLAKQGWDKVAKERKSINDIHRICIEPYVNENTNVLEIGCNGGGWTKKMLHANSFVGFDALTGFWRNILPHDNIRYVQVKDFECGELENEEIDYVFSYDVFCHISYSGAKAYLKNLYPKLKDGTNLFVMIADIDKYKDDNGLKKLLSLSGFDNLQEFVDDYDGEAKNGRWFFYGLDRFCEAIDESGYTLISRDVMGELDPRSPTVHFRK